MLPAQKLEVVRAEQAAGRTVMMVGDGVKDAPALGGADVGVAIGAELNEVALGGADVALLGTDLGRLAASHRSRRHHTPDYRTKCLAGIRVVRGPDCACRTRYSGSSYRRFGTERCGVRNRRQQCSNSALRPVRKGYIGSMPRKCRFFRSFIVIATCAATVHPALSQSLGNYGSVRGLILDTSTASIASATIALKNQLTGVQRMTSSDSSGAFQLNGIPFGVYQLIASTPGFQQSLQNVSVESPVPVELKIVLSVAGAATSVEVTEATGGALELSPTAHGTLDRSLLDHLSVQNQATGLSEMVTRTTPGVAADGNGFAHPLGEHADTSISIDNQPITDQQAKIFSNQISTSIVQTMEVVTGAPPAEFGDKTSLIINVTTQSGLGRKKPFGSLSSQYGSFGTWSEGLTYGVGLSRWGNFAAVNVSGSGRFLDSPEFQPLHDHGNAESLFDRLDWQPNDADSLHLNLSAARSWFQTPNTFDAQAAGQDQRSQIRSFNIAPGWTHLMSPSLLLTLNPFIRFDRSQYFPSANPLSDLPATVSQSRYLTNIGFRTDLAYSRGIHSAKIGVSYWHTLLRESFNIAITDPAYNAVCLNSSGGAVTDPALLSGNQCGAAGYLQNPDFIPNLLPYDLTRGGSLYAFHGDADIKELAFYAQDAIHLGG